MNRKEMAESMERVAKGPFNPVYSVVADDVIKRSGRDCGVCIDVGCAGAQLGIAIAKKSNYSLIAFDINPYALDFARQNAEEAGISLKTTVLEGDVTSISLEDNSVDLCVSRGAFWEWNDEKPFAEIYRILKPNSMAFIGCGFGSKEILDQVIEEMSTFSPGWNEMRMNKYSSNPVSKYAILMEKAKIPHFNIDDQPAGRWIMFHK